jgi:hypothetical protein
MDPLDDLIQDLISRVDVVSWGRCRVHPRGDSRCFMCQLNHVEIWDADLARLIFHVHNGQEEGAELVLWDNLSDKGLEHHYEQIMKDCAHSVAKSLNLVWREP